MTQTTRPVTTVAPLRSLLFCPATSARRVRKMLELAPDAAALDLEDAVTDDNKAAARRQAPGRRMVDADLGAALGRSRTALPEHWLAAQDGSRKK
jgi:hypothetical protein